MQINTIIIIAVSAIVILSLCGVSLNAKDKGETKTINKGTVTCRKLDLNYTIDYEIDKTEEKALEEYKTCPPLRPERFRRKMKMLLDIDINNYPDNAIISFGENFKISKKHQIITSNNTTYLEDNPFPLPEHPEYIYKTFREFLLIGGFDAFKTLNEYKTQSYNKVVNDEDYFKEYYNDIIPYCDFIYMAYRSTLSSFDFNTIQYVDNQAHFGYALLSQYSDLNYPFRLSKAKLDLIAIYLLGELDKNRTFGPSPNVKKGEIWLGFDLFDDDLLNLNYSSKLFLISIGSYNNWALNRDWHNYSAEKGLCTFLSFLLQFKNKKQNKLVIQFMSGQIDRYMWGVSEFCSEFRSNIRSNNYYGYSILREFCENPMREMPTLEKIGTHFTAKVKEQNTLLLLEPFADSYDIDTVQPTETFKAYEMGHDDYYFVEIEKPVESPVADKDGYAMILDRTETVYGYILKSKVKEYTSQSVLAEEQYTDKTQSKRGVIQDKDGYVNVRKEANSKSDIVGKIEDKEIFHYWQTADNWYIIETKDGLRGYVFKDRIREKHDTGGWTIDE